MADGFTQADNANRLANLVRLGTITEIDLTASPATARAEFEDGWVSDHLPVLQLAAGRLRTWSAPIEGEQVIALSASGELGAGWLLRGAPYDAFSAPSAEELVTVLGAWDDGAADTYDEAAKTRAIAIPAGGKLTLSVGALTIRIEAGGITVDAGGSPVGMKASKFTLDGPVDLGGAGGAAVARVGDTVTNGKIATGSSKVKAA